MLIQFKTFLFLIFVLMYMSGKCQDDELATWTLYRSSDSLDIFMRNEDCRIPSQGIYRSYCFFKFVNKTDQVINVSWYFKLWYDSTCYGCVSNEEYFRQVKIKSNSIIESSCEKFVPELMIFRRFLSYDTKEILTNFEFYNIKINTNDN